MRAVILAGGEGRRLRPYTTVLPKPLMPLGNQPILETVVKQLARDGYTDLTFAVGYLSQLIEAYFGDGSKFGVNIDYSHEDKPLGTVGPLKLIDGLEDNFLVMNGDILTDLDYGDLMAKHKASDAVATICVYQKDVPVSLGVLDLDDNDEVTGYTEKPTLHYTASTGIYCFKRDVLEHIPDDQRFDLPDLVLKLIAEQKRVFAYRFAGKWLDIGRPEDYEQATDEFERGGFL